jgi:hypothetical protein
MPGIQRGDLFNQRMLVVNKNFEVIIPHQVQVHFVPVVPDSHYKSALLVQYLYLLLQCQLLIFSPGNHMTNLLQKKKRYNIENRLVFIYKKR